MTNRIEIIDALYAQADAGTFADLTTCTDEELDILAENLLEFAELLENIDMTQETIEDMGDIE
jgi:hypothetical protein